MATGPILQVPPVGQRRECIYGQDHAELWEWSMEYLRMHRAEIGIEHTWSLMPKVVCSSRCTPEKAFEASIEWDSEVWFARINVICNLPSLLRQWVLTHELYELKHWKTGDAFQNLVALLLPNDLRDFLVRQYYAVRNQEIEQEVGQYLGFLRPNHIVSSPLVVQEKQDDEKNEALVATLQRWREEDTVPENNEEEEPWPNVIELTEEEMENIRL